MGSQHQVGLLIATECKGFEDTTGDSHMNSFWNVDKKEIYCIFNTCCIMSVFYKMLLFLSDVSTHNCVIS